MSSKVCTLCKLEKSLEEFPRQSNKAKDGRACWCKPCHAAKSKSWRERNPDKAKAAMNSYRKRNPTNHRRSFLRRTYGLKETDYERLLADQGGRCAICLRVEADCVKKFLCIDHIKGTTLIRGLLCSQCNSAIGLLNHDPELLRLAVAYLQRTPVMEGTLTPRGVHRS